MESSQVIAVVASFGSLSLAFLFLFLYSLTMLNAISSTLYTLPIAGDAVVDIDCFDPTEYRYRFGTMTVDEFRQMHQDDVAEAGHEPYEPDTYLIMDGSGVEYYVEA